MKEATARILIDSKVIDTVVIHRLVSDEYEVWLHGENMPSDVRQRLEVARGGVRLFASVDSALKVLRALRWFDSVVVEHGVR